LATKKEISAFFNHLDVETSLETISDRIKIQKLVYLAEVFGLDTGFSFTWYVYGPYSPGLTKVMFDSTNGRSSGLGETKSDLKKIQAMKDYLGDDIQSSEKLELVYLSKTFEIKKTWIVISIGALVISIIALFKPTS